MLNNIKKRNTSNQKGFTIIEVMIVLAIAGLIMLIVFLAVPALQRNARNTQRREDVGRAGAAVQEVLNNNNGQIATVTTANVQAAVGTTLAYYQQTNVTVAGVATATVTNNTTTDTVQIYTNAVCAAMTGGRGAVSTGANARSVAVVYSTEGGSAAAKVCTES